MDKDLISKIVGELYLNNYVQNQKLAAQSEEITKLRELVNKLSENKEKLCG